MVKYFYSKKMLFMVGLILFFIIKQLEELIGICIIYPFLKHMALKIIILEKWLN